MTLKTTVISAVAMAAAYAGGAQAATIDFTDPFTAVTPSASPAIPVVISEVAAGVTFTITATARGFDRFVQSANGLNFGVPGNGMRSISVVADQDVAFTGFNARDRFATLAGNPSYQASVDGVLTSIGNAVTGGALTDYSFNSGPIAVAAGEAFLFEPEVFDILIGSNLASLEFDVAIAAVPLPAGMPMLLAGLGLLGLKRKRS